ncbi:MAG: hypothetical protein P8Q41_18225 [Saprospiraceae bacterium]|nr:hypothetical protein [Saprospiraceae bacterium]
MKTLRILTTVSLAIMIASSAVAQQAEKILVKSFNLKGNTIVLMDVKGNIEVKEHKRDFIRVQMAIELRNGTSSILCSLIKAKRYNLVGSVVDDHFVLNMPSLEKRVKVGGKELSEKVSYTVFAPSDVLVKLSNDTSASRLVGKNSSEL